MQISLLLCVLSLTSTLITIAKAGPFSCPGCASDFAVASALPYAEFAVLSLVHQDAAVSGMEVLQASSRPLYLNGEDAKAGELIQVLFRVKIGDHSKMVDATVAVTEDGEKTLQTYSEAYTGIPEIYGCTSCIEPSPTDIEEVTNVVDFVWQELASKDASLRLADREEQSSAIFAALRQNPYHGSNYFLFLQSTFKSGFKASAQVSVFQTASGKNHLNSFQVTKTLLVAAEAV